MTSSDVGVTPDELVGVKVLSTGSWTHASSLRFVLPVAYPQGSYPERCRAAASFHLPGREHRFWVPDTPPADLLPHIAKYLNIDDYDASTATLLKANPDELRSLAGSRRARWTLTPEGSDRLIPFSVDSARLALFRLDLGFFAFDLKPLTESAADWFDACHHLRFFADKRGGTVRVHDPDRPEDRDSPLRTLIEAIVSTAVLPVDAAPVTVARRPRKQPELKGKRAEDIALPRKMFSYAVLYLTDVDKANDSRLIIRSQAAFAPDQPLDPVDADSDAPLGVIPLSNPRQWLFASLEGAGLLTTGPVPDIPFFREGFPGHMRREYYFMYLLVTYQRLVLSRISEEVADATLEKRLKSFAAIHERVLEFTGRGLFAQVTRSQHHHRFYELCQRINQVPQLQQEVRDEVEAMKEYSLSVVEERKSELSQRLEILIGVVTGVLIPLQVCLAVFADRVGKWPVFGSVSRSLSLWLTLGFLAVTAVATFAFLRLWRRDAG